MKPRLLRSGLTDRVYVVTRYRERGDGIVEAITKYDVTDEFAALATPHPSPAVAPQSLRDAAERVVSDWMMPNGDVPPDGFDSDGMYLDTPPTIRALRAALDAPALTVERLAEAILNHEHANSTIALSCDRGHVDGCAAAILRALGEEKP